MTTISAVQNTQELQAPKKTNKAQGGATAVNVTKPLGAEDTVETKSNGMPKLTPILYEIKDGDSLRKIADELGLKMTDLVDQLKASGKLPKDYDPSAKHTKDIGWMKKGNKIKVSYPETEKQKEDYEDFTTTRTKLYYTKKAEAEKVKKEESLKKEREIYDSLPWYSKIGKKRP